MGIDAPKAQLGQEDSDITRDFYVHKSKVAPDLTVHLAKFRPRS